MSTSGSSTSNSPWPDAFLARVREQLGPAAEDLLHALEQPPPFSLRLHPHKGPDLLPDRPHPPWAPLGRYLRTRPRFAHDPYWQAGAYYVQEASSMALTAALPAELRGPVLDLCAAPGGKSTLLLGELALRGDSTAWLLANETVKSRLPPLRENLQRWGEPRVVLTQNDPEELAHLAGQFSLVLVDAPCSGEGLWRREPAACQQWSPAAVAHCAARQQRILQAALPLLQPGGRLVYSTCTFAPAENLPPLVQALGRLGLKGQAVELPQLANWGFAPVEHQGLLGYQAWPHRVQGEGFFLAAWERADGPEAPLHLDPKLRRKAPQQLPKPFADWLDPAWGPWAAHQHPGGLNSLPHAVAQAWPLWRALRVVQAGTPLLGLPTLGAKAQSGRRRTGADNPTTAELVRDWRKRTQPEAALALCLAYQSGALGPELELDPDAALAYLRGHTALPPGREKGWHRMVVPTAGSGEPLGLGWAKWVGSRWNNAFPKGWRLRS